MNAVKFFIRVSKIIFTVFFLVLVSSSTHAQSGMFDGWKTDVENRTIELNELKSGGPPKDGIPSVDDPVYISQDIAQQWLADREPVISVNLEGTARAYPLQILIWHEIANTWFDDIPVAVTFCPLCYSALVFDRRVEGGTLELGVSGFLRHSDMVMFDRTTESLWQQITGEAIVGSYTGVRLEQIPSQIISFEQFRKIYPEGEVLSRETGHHRSYGRNPYAGYDDIDQRPMFIDDSDLDGRLRPMEKIIGVEIGDRQKVYPYNITREAGAINDEIDGKPLLILHTGGAVSAMDAGQIDQSSEAGSTGSFLRTVDDRILHFAVENEIIIDRETGSQWNIAGQAVHGPLKGIQLEPVKSGDYFAFAWLVFYPDSEIYRM